jgi:hypothetical protein
MNKLIQKIELQNHIRMVQILKTRFGEADKEIAVNFHGGINVWIELRKFIHI